MRQNPIEMDKHDLDGLFQCHMVSWKMRHRFLPAAAEGPYHREAYVSKMTEQVIGMIASQMDAKTFNYHGGVNCWRNYKSVYKSMDNTLNRLIQAEVTASGGEENDALAEEVEPSAYDGKVSALPVFGDVSMLDLKNAKEKFLSFTRKLNDVVVSFAAGDRILTSHDMRRIALLVEVNCYETYSLLKQPGIMANDFALKRARAWANKIDDAMVVASDRKFFEKFSEAVVELSKEFNFVTVVRSDHDGAAGHPEPDEMQMDHEAVTASVHENGREHHNLRAENGFNNDENDMESAEIQVNEIDTGIDVGAESVGDDDYDDDFPHNVLCEQAMEEGADPLDEASTIGGCGVGAVDADNDKSHENAVVLD